MNFKVKDLYSSNPVFRFFVNLAILYFFWKIISHFLTQVQPFETYWTSFVALVADNLISSSAKVLKLFGQKYYIGSMFGHRHIGIIGSPGVNVAFGCIGVPLMILFTGLILAFPGKITNKIWFIPLGVLGIHLINISRIVGLAFYVAYINPSIYNHKVYFNITAYTFIITMWIVWVNYFTRNKP